MQVAEKILGSLGHLFEHYPVKTDQRTRSLLCSMDCERSQLSVDSKRNVDFNYYENE